MKKIAFLRPALQLFAIAACASVALAQSPAQPEPANPQPKAANETKKDPVPPATDKSEATQAGVQEPSSKIKSSADTAVSVNGVLTAPGAATNVDTAPAKFSPRNASDDALPIAAYALKHLSADQRRGLLETLRVQRGNQSKNVNEDFAAVGAEVPTATAVGGLSAVPDSVTANLPSLRGVAFTVVGEKVVLINPRTRVVVGVLG